MTQSLIQKAKGSTNQGNTQLVLSLGQKTQTVSPIAQLVRDRAEKKLNPARDRSDDNLLINTMDITWSTVDICHIPVAFPHTTICDTQMVYMTWLIKAIMEGKNAVLESATGTGKTAMMVSSCDLWMDEAHHKHRDRNPH